MTVSEKVFMDFMSEPRHDLVLRAFSFAFHAHEGQSRKYDGQPYIVHPVAVAKMVEEVGGTKEMIAAALLHDVVEDTPATLEDIRDEFGSAVANLVYWLTDVSRPSDGNRKKRKAMDRAHIASAPAQAKTVKLADLIDNGVSILKHDKDFSRVFFREKDALLAVLQTGNVTLLERAEQLVEEAFEELDMV